MEVRLSGAARKYLRKETAYLRRHSSSAADAFVARIKNARQNLGSFPQLGIGPERLPIPNAQCLIVGDYLIDYDIGSEGILITSVRHSRMTTPTLPADENFDYESDRSDRVEPK